MPFCASIRITASCAVLAPVTMLRVYCSWPGTSAMMNRRRAVAKQRYATSIVIPCSRSAFRPSVKKEKSISLPFFAEALRTEEMWSW